MDEGLESWDLQVGTGVQNLSWDVQAAVFWWLESSCHHVNVPENPTSQTPKNSRSFLKNASRTRFLGFGV